MAEQNALIIAMVNNLPPNGAQWSIEARQNWLGLMDDIFNLVYTEPPAPPKKTASKAANGKIGRPKKKAVTEEPVATTLNS